MVCVESSNHGLPESTDTELEPDVFIGAEAGAADRRTWMSNSNSVIMSRAGARNGRERKTASGEGERAGASSHNADIVRLARDPALSEVRKTNTCTDAGPVQLFIMARWRGAKFRAWSKLWVFSYKITCDGRLGKRNGTSCSGLLQQGWANAVQRVKREGKREGKTEKKSNRGRKRESEKGTLLCISHKHYELLWLAMAAAAT